MYQSLKKAFNAWKMLKYWILKKLGQVMSETFLYGQSHAKDLAKGKEKKLSKIGQDQQILISSFA